MEKKEKLLRSILTAATVLLLVLLAWQCLDIYIAGNSPANLDENGLFIRPVYRAEDVIMRLKGLRIWVTGYLVLLIAVSVMLPDGVRKGSGVPMEPDNRLRLMKKRIFFHNHPKCFCSFYDFSIGNFIFILGKCNHQNQSCHCAGRAPLPIPGRKIRRAHDADTRRNPLRSCRAQPRSLHTALR